MSELNNPKARLGSERMYVIQWTDSGGRMKEKTVWADNGLDALRQVQRSTARIVSPSPNVQDQAPANYLK